MFFIGPIVKCAVQRCKTKYIGVILLRISWGLYLIGLQGDKCTRNQCVNSVESSAVMSCLKSFSKLVFLSLVVIYSLCHRHLLQFDLLGEPLIDYTGLQVDKERRPFVAAGNQLLRFSSDLVMEQNISLASTAVNICIIHDGERLIVCKGDLFCVVYNTSDLTVQPIDTGINLLGVESITLFST